jgi:hypothetical protein
MKTKSVLLSAAVTFAVTAAFVACDKKENEEEKTPETYIPPPPAN